MWEQSQIPKAMNGSFTKTENQNEIDHYSGGNDDGRAQEWPA